MDSINLKLKEFVDNKSKLSEITEFLSENSVNMTLEDRDSVFALMRIVAAREALEKRKQANKID